jgi:hypothetical protein
MGFGNSTRFSEFKRARASRPLEPKDQKRGLQPRMLSWSRWRNARVESSHSCRLWPSRLGFQATSCGRKRACAEHTCSGSPRIRDPGLDQAGHEVNLKFAVTYPRPGRTDPQVPEQWLIQNNFQPRPGYLLRSRRFELLNLNPAEPIPCDRDGWPRGYETSWSRRGPANGTLASPNRNLGKDLARGRLGLPSRCSPR